MNMLIPISYLLALKHYLEHIDKMAVSRIIPDDLKGPMISADDYLAVIGLATQHFPNPHLGLGYGQALNVLSHGELGIAMLSCRDLKDAIAIGIQYIQTRKPLIKLDLKYKHQKAYLMLKPIKANALTQQFIVDSTLANIHSMRLFLLGENASPCEVAFAYAAPSSVHSHKKILGDNLIFNSAQYYYAMPLSELNKSLPMADNINRSLAIQQCQAMLEKIQYQSDIATQVKQVLLARPGMLPNLNDAAIKLLMSSRTLRRKLNEANTSFKAIKHEVQHDLAKHYLQETSLAITQIAHLVGYNEASNFSKAFHSWQGMSPLQFRRQD